MKLIDELRNRLTPKTPADRERVKKIAVYTVLCLSCLVCIWLIFAPSGDDEAVAGKANTELPDGTTDGIPDSKIAAYQQAAQNKEKETRQAQLESISATLDTVATQSTTDMPDAIQSSADAYQQAQASLQDFLYLGAVRRGTAGCRVAGTYRRTGNATGDAGLQPQISR